MGGPRKKKPVTRVLNQETEMVQVKHLKNHPSNARRGNVQAIKDSILTNGFYGSLIVQTSTGHVLAGNHTLQAAVELGITSVPVTWVDVDDQEALRILAADNRTHELGDGYDQKILAELLQALDDQGSLLGTGYTQEDYDDLLAELSSPLAVQKYETASVRLTRLTPHPRNYKAHPDDQVEQIMASIRQNGFYRNVVVSKDDVILAGHGVVEACKRLGVVSVPVFRLPIEADSVQALKLLAVDNELAKFGKTNDRALSELLREVRESDFEGLLGTGYTDQMLAALVMVSRPASEIKNMDEAAEWVGMPEYQAGEHPIKLIINFDSFEDRQAFLGQVGMNILKRMDHDHTWTSRWPISEREDVANLEFGVDDEEGEEDGEDSEE